MPSATSEQVELLPGYWVDQATGAWCTLPWPRDPVAKDLLLRNSLGPGLIQWAHWERLDIGPGLIDYQTGAEWRYTPGQQRFLILWYAYDPATGRWLYRRGVKRGAKGTGKDPLAAAMCLGELIGPAKLHQLDNGQWIGVPHRMPLVQIASNSETQSKDVLRIANAMLCREARDWYGIDCGETRTILASADETGGRLEVLTASEKSSEGDPATFVALNESHHMTESSGGTKVAAVARRNVGKSPAHIQARLCEYTNAHQQGSESVGEKSFEAWQLQVSGRAKRRDILYDSIEAPPDTDIYDDESRRAGLVAAYMDAWWADIDRLEDEMLDPDTTVGDSIRYYLNGLAAAEDAWVDPRKFDAAARPDWVIEDREQIAMFLDCSKSSDATGLVACRISDGHVFVLGVWQKPHGTRGKNWLVPRHEVDAVGRAAYERYHVVWCGVDPSPAKDDEDEHLYWRELVDGWHRDWSKKLKIWATPGAKGHSVLFDMRIKTPGSTERNRLFTEAAGQVAQEIDEDETLTHDGHPALRTHVHNARRRPNQWGTSLGKATRGSSKLVDLAVCMVGARMGRRIALNSGKLPKKKTGRSAF